VKPRVAFITIITAIFLFSVAGCVTTDGSNSGWVVVDPPSSPPPPKTKKQPPTRYKENKGQQVAARNHLRNAYRFLQKNKPDHAMRELEKARMKMGKNYWFHYYYGGAYYLKGMFGQARDSWDRAYRYTYDYPRRSRVRTCQSFAIFNLDGHGPSMVILEKAVNIDRKNTTAFELYQDLRGTDSYSSYNRPADNKSSSSPYLQDKFGQKSRSDDDEYANRDDEDSKHGKGNKKKDNNKNKKHDKKKPKKFKVQNPERFRVYFMIEMP
jgi:hypothetical protein